MNCYKGASGQTSQNCSSRQLLAESFSPRGPPTTQQNILMGVRVGEATNPGPPEAGPEILEPP